MALIHLPGHLLRRCHQISVAIFLDECAQYDLTPVQYAALMTLLERGPQDQATLGRATALDRTTTAVVVKKLVERGFITRTPSGRDRRSMIVEITAEGKIFLEAVTPSVDRAQERTVGPLNARESQQLLRLLGKLAEENNDHSRAPLRNQRITRTD